MSWDLLLLAAQMILDVGPVYLLIDRAGYMPRWGSALLVVGLVLMTTALMGLNAPFGAASAAVGAVIWFGVFLFRGKKQCRT